jgi:hypothetical protein
VTVQRAKGDGVLFANARPADFSELSGSTESATWTVWHECCCQENQLLHPLQFQRVGRGKKATLYNLYVITITGAFRTHSQSILEASITSVLPNQTCFQRLVKIDAPTARLSVTRTLEALDAAY